MPGQRAKQVAEVLAFVVTIVTLVAWVTGTSSLPDLIGSHDDSHPKSSATGSPPVKAAPSKPTASSSEKLNPPHKPNPLTIALTMGPDGRVREGVYKGAFGYEWAVKLNGGIPVPGCSLREHVYDSSGAEVLTPPGITPCRVTAEIWSSTSVKELAAGVYTVKLDVTTTQGYKASASVKFTLLK